MTSTSKLVKCRAATDELIHKRKTSALTKVPHTWLGSLCRPDLNLLPALKRRGMMLDGAVAGLTGVVTCHSLPIAIASDMFESRVDGAVRVAHWLLVTCDGAEEFLIGNVQAGQER